jgi:hypothetical protein
VNLPSELAGYIRSNTQNYGKAKLVLKRNKFWVESPHREVLETLLEDEGVAQVRRRGGGGGKASNQCVCTCGKGRTRRSGLQEEGVSLRWFLLAIQYACSLHRQLYDLHRHRLQGSKVTCLNIPLLLPPPRLL